MKKFKTIKDIFNDIDNMPEKDLKKRVKDILHYCYNHYKNHDEYGDCLDSCDSYGHDSNCPNCSLSEISGHLSGITDGVDFFSLDLELKEEIKKELNENN